MNRSTAGLSPIHRVATGIAGLDTLLHGGFLQRGIYLIMGAPGVGKTVLANQICFNHVADGGRAVFLTLLSESSTQMLSHMRGMSFVDMSKVGNAMFYFSGYNALDSGGLDGLLKLIQQVMRDQHPTMLVMDGMAYTEALAESELRFKEFIQTLHAYAEAAGCTSLLLAAAPGPQALVGTIVDGLLELDEALFGVRAARTIRIAKLRGSAHLNGKHLFEISNDGITVYPRTEAVAPRMPDGAGPETRSTFGVAQLDDMLQGGMPPSTSTMLLGVPGSGKTLLGSSFLAAGARMNEAGLYFGFYEPPLRLIAKADAIALDLGSHVASGQVEIMWQAPAEGVLDKLAVRLLDAVQRRQVRRVFVDGMVGFQEAAVDVRRLGPFLIALFNELRALHVTVLFSVEMRNLFGPTVETPLDEASAIADNIILLRYVELYSQLFRLISIIKVRDSGYDTSIREFKISPQGIEVARTFESAQAVLTGIAQPILSPVQPTSRSRKRTRSS